MATASPSAALLDRLERQGIPKSKRKLQKHLRSAGLAYISRTGKLIPAKKVAGELCQCPQKCDERVPLDARDRLFTHFYGLGEADMQNQFLRQNMDLRARLNVPESTGSGRPPRRITCKYLVPLLPASDTVEVCQKAFVSAFVITTKRVRLQREKLIASLGLNSYSSHSRASSSGGATAASATTNRPSPSPENTFLTQYHHNNNNTNNSNNNNNNGAIPRKTYSNTSHTKLSPSATAIITSTILKLPALTCELLQGPSSSSSSSSTSTSHHHNNNNNNHRASTTILQHHLNKASHFHNNNNNNSNMLDLSMIDDAIMSEPKTPEMPQGNEKSRRRVDNPLIPLGLLVPDGVTIAPVTATADHARDIAIVNNFFSNQLWKPEYIGTYS